MPKSATGTHPAGSGGVSLTKPSTKPPLGTGKDKGDAKDTQPKEPQKPTERTMAQKQADLNAAMSQAVAVANRYAGKRVSAGVLNARLSSIRSHYQMQVLYPVKAGKTWDIYGKVNSEKKVSSQAQTGDSDAQNKLNAAYNTAHNAYTPLTGIFDQIKQETSNKAKIAAQTFTTSFDQYTQTWASLKKDTKDASNDEELAKLVTGELHNFTNDVVVIIGRIQKAAGVKETDQTEEELKLSKVIESSEHSKHGDKHFKAKDDEDAKKITTPTDKNNSPIAQYLHSEKENVATMELTALRAALANKTYFEIGDKNVTYFYYNHGKTIGYDMGQAASWMRVEISSGVRHSHPIAGERLADALRNARNYHKEKR